MDAGTYIVGCLVITWGNNHFFRIEDTCADILQLVDGHHVMMVAHNSVVGFLEVISRRCSMGML